MIHRCVIFHRDEKGFGFTVCGDNPVFVENVKLSKFHPLSYLRCGPISCPYNCHAFLYIWSTIIILGLYI